MSNDSNNSRRTRRGKLRSIRERNMVRNRRMLNIRLAVLAVSLLAVLVAYLFLTLWMKAHPR